MKPATLPLTIVAAFILAGGTLFSQIKQEIPKYEYKVEGEWILGPTLKWPLKGSDGNNWPTREGSKLAEERWEKGEVVKLSGDDMDAIRTIVSKTVPPKNSVKIEGVKMISEREYMVYVYWYVTEPTSNRFSGGGHRYVIAKSGNGWVLIGYYHHWSS